MTQLPLLTVKFADDTPIAIEWGDFMVSHYEWVFATCALGNHPECNPVCPRGFCSCWCHEP